MFEHLDKQSLRSRARECPRLPSLGCGALGLVAAAAATLFTGCASAPTIDVRELPRRTTPAASLPAAEFEPAMVFSAGSAWVVGAPDLEPGAWVSATPGPLWPGEPTPSLVVGRVVERSELWARIEVAGAVDGIRDPALQVTEVSPSALPAVTRRLVPVRTQGGETIAPVGTEGLVSDAGIYGVLRLNASSAEAGLSAPPEGTRLGGYLVGLARLVAVGPDTSVVSSERGDVAEDGDYLVFLGVDPGRPPSVTIAVGGDDLAPVSAALDARIDLETIPALSLGAADTGALGDALVVRITGDAGGWEIAGQTSRVAAGSMVRGPAGLIRRAPDRAPTAALAAALAVARVYTLRGQFAHAAWHLEAELRSAPTPETLLAVAPLLAASYRDLWRRDLAFEVALQVSALADVTDGATQRRALASALAASVAAGASDEAVVLADALAASAGNDPERVGVAGRVALAAHALQARHWNDAARWTRALPEGGEPGWLRIALTVARWQARGEALPEDLVASADALAGELGPLYARELATWLAVDRVRASGLVAADTLELVDQLDRNGAPGLGYDLVLDVAGALDNESQRVMVDQLLQQAAAFAWAARRPLAMAHLLVELDFGRLEGVGESPVSGDLLARHLETLAAADLRVWLGRRALVNAQLAAERTTQRETLQLARMLFASVGDPLNTAIAELRLAQVEIADGRRDAARAWLESARRYEPAARDAALSALRQRLEDAVDAPLPEPPPEQLPPEVEGTSPETLEP